jgi:hypothetical protein
MEEANRIDQLGDIPSSTVPLPTNSSEHTGYGGDDLAQILAGRRAMQNATSSNIRHELVSYIAEGLVTPKQGMAFNVLGWWKVCYLTFKLKYTFSLSTIFTFRRMALDSQFSAASHETTLPFRAPLYHLSEYSLMRG